MRERERVPCFPKNLLEEPVKKKKKSWGSQDCNNSLFLSFRLSDPLSFSLSQHKPPTEKWASSKKIATQLLYSSWNHCGIYSSTRSSDEMMISLSLSLPPSHVSPSHISPFRYIREFQVFPLFFYYYYWLLLLYNLLFFCMSSLSKWGFCPQETRRYGNMMMMSCREERPDRRKKRENEQKKGRKSEIAIDE